MTSVNVRPPVPQIFRVSGLRPPDPTRYLFPVPGSKARGMKDLRGVSKKPPVSFRIQRELPRLKPIFLLLVLLHVSVITIITIPITRSAAMLVAVSIDSAVH